MINKVEICGVNTSKLPVLTNKEKDELFIKIKQGDEKALERLGVDRWKGKNYLRKVKKSGSSNTV